MAASGFDKDFGYLMPFLGKVAEAANTITDPAAREELKRLVAGEQSRWLRIQQLLSGAAAQAAAPANQRLSQARRQRSPLLRLPGRSLPPERRFTVGSLRPR